jgi:hypothetical protein
MKKFEFIRTLLENFGGDFNRYDDSDIKEFLEVSDEHDLTLDDVENFAVYHGLPSTNNDVVDLFFSNHASVYDENSNEHGEGFWDDITRIRDDFGNYIDMLNRGGQLHPLQYNEYDIDDTDIKNAFQSTERDSYPGQ